MVGRGAHSRACNPQLTEEMPVSSTYSDTESELSCAHDVELQPEGSRPRAKGNKRSRGLKTKHSRLSTHELDDMTTKGDNPPCISDPPSSNSTDSCACCTIKSACDSYFLHARRCCRRRWPATPLRGAVLLVDTSKPQHCGASSSFCRRRSAATKELL